MGLASVVAQVLRSFNINHLAKTTFYTGVMGWADSHLRDETDFSVPEVGTLEDVELRWLQEAFSQMEPTVQGALRRSFECGSARNAFSEQPVAYEQENQEGHEGGRASSHT